MGNHKNNGDMRKTGDDFRLSAGPVDTFARAQRAPFDLPEIIGLSAPVGPPVLFAIARDPRSIFTYWSVDWPSVFEFARPADRKAHLRVYRAGAEESSAVVEPMSGNHYLTVAQPGDVYRVEIGYFQPGEKWCSVAMSEEITMPVEGPANSLDVDLATLPFHLSFQRLINLFRANNGDALVEIISRLQRRAVSAEERKISVSSGAREDFDCACVIEMPEAGDDITTEVVEVAQYLFEESLPVLGDRCRALGSRQQSSSR